MFDKPGMDDAHNWCDVNCAHAFRPILRVNLSGLPIINTAASIPTCPMVAVNVVVIYYRCWVMVNVVVVVIVLLFCVKVSYIRTYVVAVESINNSKKIKVMMKKKERMRVGKWSESEWLNRYLSCWYRVVQ